MDPEKTISDKSPLEQWLYEISAEANSLSDTWGPWFLRSDVKLLSPNSGHSTVPSHDP